MVGDVVPDVKKIVVVRANALGDFIFSVPALSALRETYPGAEIVLIAQPWHKAFLEGRAGPWDRVIVPPVSQGVRGSENADEDPPELERFFEAMQQEHFDIALQMHGGGRNSNPFTARLGARVTAGARTPDAMELDRNTAYIYYQIEYLRYLEIVALVGAQTHQIEPYLEVMPEDLQEVEERVPELQEPYAVLHPGVTDSRRRWPAERFAAVGDRLAREGCQVLVTGVDAERDVVEAVVDHMACEAVNLCGRLTLSGLTGLLSGAAVVISNDTGPHHLAYSVGAPVVGIYWIGNLINGGPLTRTNCRPHGSFMIYCPLCNTDMTRSDAEDHDCPHDVSFVTRVTVDEVAESALDLLTNWREVVRINTVPPMQR